MINFLPKQELEGPKSWRSDRLDEVVLTPDAKTVITWGFWKIVVILCVMFLPFFILSSGILPFRELTVWCLLLLLGFLAGLKSRSHWMALNSVLVTAVIVTLILAVVTSVRFHRIGLAYHYIGFGLWVCWSFKSLVPMTVFTLILFLCMALGVVGGLIFRYLWSDGLKKFRKNKVG